MNPNTQKKLGFVLATLMVLGALLASTVYVVDEGTRAIKLRFNKVNRDSSGQVTVYQPGLHFKLPFGIDKVVTLDARLQTLDDPADRFVTIEKKDVLIDSYVKWRIVDFGKFYTTTGGVFTRADNILRRKISDRLRLEVGNQTISDIVSGQRGELMAQAKQALNSNDGGAALGVEIVDVRVNKIELPDEVSSSIYRRMRAERQVVAGEHRAKGQEQAQKIRAETDRNVRIILADAELAAKKIRAEAEAQASQIYNSTYAQNVELFEFLKYMDSYTKSFSQYKSVLLIKPTQDSFYNYLFNNSIVKQPGVSKPAAPVAPAAAAPSASNP